jgi:hypothetical protein
MSRDVYLSVDLDFWGDPDGAPLSTLSAFLKRFPAIPTKVVRSHEELLPHANNTACSTLVNVDFHSDLGGNDPGRGPPEVGDGTWVDHVRWRDGGQFVWRCPSYKHCVTLCGGLCGFEGFYYGRRHPPRYYSSFRTTSWAGTFVSEGLRGISMARVAAIGVAISPDWLARPLPAALPFLRAHNPKLARKTAVLFDDLKERNRAARRQAG